MATKIGEIGLLTFSRPTSEMDRNIAMPIIVLSHWRHVRAHVASVKGLGDKSACSGDLWRMELRRRHVWRHVASVKAL